MSDMSDRHNLKNKQRDPVTLEVLKKMLANGAVNQMTSAWKEG